MHGVMSVVAFPSFRRCRRYVYVYVCMYVCVCLCCRWHGIMVDKSRLSAGVATLHGQQQRQQQQPPTTYPRATRCAQRSAKSHTRSHTRIALVYLWTFPGAHERARELVAHKSTHIMMSGIPRVVSCVCVLCIFFSFVLLVHGRERERGEFLVGTGRRTQTNTHTDADAQRTRCEDGPVRNGG